MSGEQAKPAVLQNIEPYVVHQAYLADHRADGLRSGEGCMEVLKDGSLFLVYGRFDGPGDAAPATLVETRSADGGRTWSAPRVFLPTPPDVLNLMSVSLLRLHDGRLAAVFLRKQSLDDCRPWIMFSNDADGWTEPVPAIERPGYYVINNDRLVQLKNGRILLPFAYYKPVAGVLGKSTNGCLYSDDAGRRWQIGEEIVILPENVLAPKFIVNNNQEAVRHIVEKNLVCQEPGVVELTDGRVCMWCRTNGGYAYRALSEDGGKTWAQGYQAIPEFAMPCGPQSIKRLPGSKRLLMLYNDRNKVPLGADQFNWRRPLWAAVSDDDARTWRALGLLEPETVPTTCYYSIAFHGDNVVFSYYEGVMQARPDGWFVPRNLASLKLKIVRRAFFDL